jgi:hypothetical protein
MLSLGFNRYYEPLRLPFRAAALSYPYTHRSVFSPPPKRVSSTGQYILDNMPSLLPREMTRTTSVFSERVRRPSPSDHRLGFSNSFTRLLMGSLALRPAILLFGNSRPRVTTTPLPHATKVYGQLLGRDFNPLDLLLLLRTVRSRFVASNTHSCPQLRNRPGLNNRTRSKHSGSSPSTPLRPLPQSARPAPSLPHHA